MNKETRNFVWGLILLFVCGTGVAINIANMMAGKFNWTPDLLIFLPFQLFGVVSGGIRIFKSVD